jgi:hypothetical protein
MHTWHGIDTSDHGEGMSQDHFSDLKSIKVAALERRRRQLEEGQQVERKFIETVRELRDSVLASGLSGGTRFRIAQSAGLRAVADPSVLTLVVLPQAVATGSAARRSEWWDLVIGRDIPPAIARFDVDQPIPREEYEQIQCSIEEVVGLSAVMENRRHFGLNPQVMMTNLQRAIMRYRMSS